MQVLLNSLIAGSIYALIASGFSIVYATNRFMHFAHGSSVVMGGYMLYSLFTIARVPFILSAILTIFLSSLLGIGIYRFVYRPIQRQSNSNVLSVSSRNIILLIAGLALLIFFQNILQLIFGSDIKSIGFSHNFQKITILGAQITSLHISIIIIAVIVFSGLYYLMNKTSLGRDIKAVYYNKELAATVGINQQRVVDYSFFISSGLGGLAGVLVGLELGLTPEMGTVLAIKGFISAVIGGLGGVFSAIIGAFILGFAENFGVLFLPSAYKQAIAFVILFIFLIFRPKGLFWKRSRK